ALSSRGAGGGDGKVHPPPPSMTRGNPRVASAIQRRRRSDFSSCRSRVLDAPNLRMALSFFARARELSSNLREPYGRIAGVLLLKPVGASWGRTRPFAHPNPYRSPPLLNRTGQDPAETRLRPARMALA